MKKISLVFPGQGSQYVGMGKSYFDSSNTAKRIFEEVSHSLEIDMAKLCFESSPSELLKTENTQPAILTVSVAMFSVYMEQIGIEPLFLAGHSLGEISALVCAGGIKLGDAARIVRQRGRFMQEAVTLGEGAMAAISEVEVEIIEKQCQMQQKAGRIVVISNYNSPNQTVISGTTDGVEQTCMELKKVGARVIPLNVSAPFHSQLMRPAAEKFRVELENYKYHPLNRPVISNVSALPYLNEGSIKENLYHQIYMPVQWAYTMNYFNMSNVDTVVEIGPKNVLKNLSIMNCPKIEAFSFDTSEDSEKIANLIVSKHQVHSVNRIKLLTRCLAIAICTPNSNWDNDEYRTGVIEPYKKIERYVEDLEKSNEEPSQEQMIEALEMLSSVFRTKGTPLEEQIGRFHQLIEELGMDEFIRSIVSVKREGSMNDEKPI